MYMDFEIVFYKNKEGLSPVEKFLLEQNKKNRILVTKTLQGIEKLRNQAYHREPLSKYLEAGLWELRIRAKTDILRVIYTFHKGRIIILLHVFIKKQQKTPVDELKVARIRLKEIQERETN